MDICLESTYQARQSRLVNFPIIFSRAIMLLNNASAQKMRMTLDDYTKVEAVRIGLTELKKAENVKKWRFFFFSKITGYFGYLGKKKKGIPFSSKINQAFSNGKASSSLQCIVAVCGSYSRSVSDRCFRWCPSQI